MRRRPVPYAAAFAFLSMLFLLAGSGRAFPGSLSGGGGGAGANVNIIVREVKVTPIRAHVGDVIRIDMQWIYWGDLHNNHYETTDAEIRANGKVVASVPFTYEYGASLGDEYRRTFSWDTKGAAPGEYRIRGEVSLWLDGTPYDNFLEVQERLILLPPGAEFPEGRERGGAAVARNPYWLRNTDRAAEKSGGGSGGGGY
jgi:hypothetical protein